MIMDIEDGGGGGGGGTPGDDHDKKEYFEYLAIHVKSRTTNGLRVHQVLTRYSRDIRTRLGMNHPEHNDGVIFVEFRSGSYVDRITSELESLGAEVKRIRFEKTT